MKAKIKFSTLDKIFKFLEKEKREAVPSTMKYLTGEIKFEIAKENLSVTKFQNGDPIPEARTEEEWVELGKEKSPGFMRNGNDVHYNHYAVMDERDICLLGWRVPTEEELLLIKYQKLYRNFPLAGYRSFFDGVVYGAGSTGGYWSSTVDGIYARRLYFGSSNDNVNRGYRADGSSVRCVRDKK